MRGFYFSHGHRSLLAVLAQDWWLRETAKGGPSVDQPLHGRALAALGARLGRPEERLASRPPDPRRPGGA